MANGPLTLDEVWRQMIADVGGVEPDDNTLISLMLAFGLGVGASVETISAIADAVNQPGMSDGLVVRGGTVTVVNEKLNAQEAGYLVPASSADQSSGMQAFITAVGNAVGGKGGAGVVPPGQYNMGSTSLSYPAVHTCDIEGALSGQGPVYQSGGTILYWTNDVAGPPHTTFGLDMTPATKPTLRNIALLGPSTFGGQNGGMRCALAGVRVGGGARMEYVQTATFSTGIGLGGQIGAGPARSADHSSFHKIETDTVGYAFNFLPGSSTGGDNKFYDCNDLSVYLAGFGIAQSGSTALGGGFLDGVGIYGPCGFYRYSDGSGLADPIFENTVANYVSCEFSDFAMVYDELWASGSLGSIVSASQFNTLISSTPHSTSWSKTFSVASSSGTSLTVTDGSGWCFQPGMTVTGSGVPGGTTIVSVAGTWPWATATLTLSQSVSSPASVVIAQPLLGSIVCASIIGNQFNGPMSAGSTTAYPYLYGRWVQGNDVFDAAAYGKAQLTNLTQFSTVGIGNSYGDGRSQIISSGFISSGGCAAGDLLMTLVGDATGGYLVKCDGSRKPVGVAMQAVGSTGCVDFQIRGGVRSSPTVNNRSGSNIAANALLKVDVSNPGGVTTATSLADGPAIGVNGTSIISAGSAGTASEIWL